MCSSGKMSMFPSKNCTVTTRALLRLQRLEYGTHFLYVSGGDGAENHI